MSHDPRRSVHALVQIADPVALIWEEGQPQWALAALLRTPWVVIRRETPRRGLLPVGVRGATRAQRCAAWLPEHAVREVIAPEMLAARIPEACRRPDNCSPARLALDDVKPILESVGWGRQWGPVGGVGFELASGARCTTVGSDLDLIIRADVRIALDIAISVYRRLSALSVRVDALIETYRGAVALTDYVTTRGSFMLRSAEGPALIEDPWHVAQVGIRSA